MKKIISKGVEAFLKESEGEFTLEYVNKAGDVITRDQIVGREEAINTINQLSNTYKEYGTENAYALYLKDENDNEIAYSEDPDWEVRENSLTEGSDDIATAEQYLFDDLISGDAEGYEEFTHYVMDISKSDYNRALKNATKVYKNVEDHIYNSDGKPYLELHAHHTMNNLTNENRDIEDWGYFVETAIDSFEEATGVELWQAGRMGRHMVVELNYDNAKRFDELVDVCEEMEQIAIDEFNKEEDLGEAEDSKDGSLVGRTYKCIKSMSHPNMGKMFTKGKTYRLSNEDGDNTVTLGGWNIDKSHLGTHFEEVKESELKEDEYVDPTPEMKIKDWYTKIAPTDYQLDKINSETTFEGMKDYYDKNGKLVLSLIGDVDTDPRETIITAMADLYDMPTNDLDIEDDYIYESEDVDKVLNMSVKELRDYDKGHTYQDSNLASYVRNRLLYDETGLARHEKAYKDALDKLKDKENLNEEVWSEDKETEYKGVKISIEKSDKGKRCYIPLRGENFKPENGTQFFNLKDVKKYIDSKLGEQNLNEEILSDAMEDAVRAALKDVDNLVNTIKHVLEDDVMTLNAKVEMLNDKIHLGSSEIELEDLYKQVADIKSDLEYALKDSEWSKEEALEDSENLEESSERYIVKKIDEPIKHSQPFGVYDTEEDRYVLQGSKKVCIADARNRNGKSVNEDADPQDMTDDELRELCRKEISTGRLTKKVIARAVPELNKDITSKLLDQNVISREDLMRNQKGYIYYKGSGLAKIIKWLDPVELRSVCMALGIAPKLDESEDTDVYTELEKSIHDEIVFAMNSKGKDPKNFEEVVSFCEYGFQSATFLQYEENTGEELIWWPEQHGDDFGIVIEHA